MEIILSKIKKVGLATPGSLLIPDISKFSASNNHSVVVTATDADGLNATPYMLTVIESSIDLKSSVSSVTATIGLAYKITYTVTNKVLGSDTSLIVTNITNGVSKTYELGKFSSTEALLYDVDFFSLFSRNCNRRFFIVTIEAFCANIY